MPAAATPKAVIGLSVVLLILAAIFGILNTQKVRAMQANVANAQAARDTAERRRLAEEKDLKARETGVVAASAKVAETESKAAKAEADFVQ
jgi:hypothetical protein